MAAGVGTKVRIVDTIFNVFTMTFYAGLALALVPENKVAFSVAPGLPFDQRRHEVFRYFTFFDDYRYTVTKRAIDPDCVTLLISVSSAVAAETAR